MRLYEINAEIDNCIDYETGEILDIEKFQELQIEKEHKLEAIALVYKNAIAESKMVSDEMKSLKARKEKCDNLANKMKEMLYNELQGEKFMTSKVEVSFKKSTITEVIDLAGIPEQYIKTKIERTADKTAIKNAIKSGEKIKGARLIEKNNIQIN